MRRDRVLSLQIANPDEAELLASGRRAVQSLVPYSKFTSPTYGPVWAMFLGVLGKLGVPLTLPTAHVLSALLAASTCVVVMIAVSRLGSYRLAILTVGPLSLYWAYGFDHPDYWSLSTELLPMLILLTGCAVGFAGWQSKYAVLVGSALVGLGAWSKYFFGLIGVVVLLALCAVLVQLGMSRKKALLLVAVSSNAPSFSLYAIALIRGVPAVDILESLRLTFQYVSGGGSGGLGEVQGVLIWNRLAALARSIAALFPLMLVLVRIINPRHLSVSTKSRRCWAFLTTPRWPVLIVLASATTILANPVVFPHYNYVLVTGALSGLLAELQRQNSNSETRPSTSHLSSGIWEVRDRLGELVMVLTLCMVAPAFGKSEPAEPTIRVSKFFSSEAGRWERAFNADGVPLSKFCQPGDSAFVWGWSPEIYAFYDLRPVSRFVAPAGLIEGNKLNLEVEPLRRRATEDILQDLPDCVIDAVGPSFFPGYGEEESFQNQMPMLWENLKTRSREYIFYWDHVNPVKVLVSK